MGIGPGNGLSRVRHQAIFSTNVDLLSIGSLGTNFIQESVFENVVYEMAATVQG